MGRGSRRKDAAPRLPRKTFVVYDPATVRPIREIVDLLRSAADRTFRSIPEGGHTAPLTRLDIVNPIIEEFLED